MGNIIGAKLFSNATAIDLMITFLWRKELPSDHFLDFVENIYFANLDRLIW